MGSCTSKSSKKPARAPVRPTAKLLPFRLLELLNSLSAGQVQQLHLRYKMNSPGRGIFPDALPRVFPHVQSLSDSIRNSVFSALDLDRDNVIGFTELCIAAVVGTQGDTPQLLEYIFSVLDLKGDKLLDREELATVLSSSFLVLKNVSGNALTDSKTALAAVPESGLDFDHFKQWADARIDLVETSQFLRILSTPQEECDELVRRFEAHLDQAEDETWFLVSSRWLARWARRCSFDLKQLLPYFEAPLKTEDDGSPFPLDNNDLADPMDPANLLETVRKGADFCLVNELVWEFLCTTYGEGLAFPRKVVRLEDRLTVNLFPATVKVFRLQGDSYNKRRPSTMMLPLSWTLSQLKGELSRVLTQLKEDFELLLLDHKCWTRVACSCSLEECAATGGALRFLCVPSSSDWFGSDSLDVVKPTHVGRTSPVRRVRLKGQPAEESLQGVEILLMSAEEKQHSMQGLLPLAPDEDLQGFPNLSNTCYLNVVLQVLAHTPMLGNFIRAQGFLPRLDVKRTAFLVQLMSLLFRDMHTRGGAGPDTEMFLLLLGEKVPTFERSAEQHDSYECLNAVLDVLHTELKQGSSPALIKEISSPSKPQESSACWAIYSAMRSAGSSCVSDLFLSILKSEIFCENCGFRKVTVNSTLSVYLPMPVAHIVQLKVSVFYLQGEVLHVGLEADLRDTVLQVLQGVSVLAGLDYTQLKLIAFREKESFVVYLLSTKVQEIVENDRGTLFAVECRQYRSAEQRPDQPPPPDTDRPTTPQMRIELITVKVIHKFAYRTKNRTVGALPAAISLPRVVTYSEITAALARYARQFSGDDKESFSLQFLDFRSYRCCLCADKSCEGCALPDTDTVIDWEGMKGKAPAFVISWFEGEFKVRGRYHPSFEEIEAKCKRGFDFSECLNLQNDAKASEASCSQCSSELKTKEQLIYPGDVFLVCLERFTRFHGRLYKNKHLVKFPVVGLDLGKWLDSKLLVVRQDRQIFDLYAVVNHEGSANSGHSTAYCKMETREQWLYCDDSRLLEVTGDAEDKVVTSDAYILCYRRRNLSGRSLVQLTV